MKLLRVYLFKTQRSKYYVQYFFKCFKHVLCVFLFLNVRKENEIFRIKL